ncbi:MAG: hypothetical protein SGJ05_10465 [bacterium]|nr:hypothetical protein [bacterium]
MFDNSEIRVMTPFTPDQRNGVYERMLVIARADSRITGGAVVGSGAVDALDAWSDLDLTFGVQVGVLSDYGARGPSFRLLFGSAAIAAPSPVPPTNDMIGWCWHHILHANAAIERARNWQAEFWISGARDYIVELRCTRNGVPNAHGRGVHLLPERDSADLDETLVRTTDSEELRRALNYVTSSYLSELVSQGDVELALKLVATLNGSSESKTDIE